MNIFLRNKQYRKFSIASFLSSAGDILFYLAFMTYASKLENYSLALSLIAISESVPRLFDIFGGYLADKTRKKFQNIFLMAIVRFILYALVGFLFMTNISSWNLVVIIVIINFLSDTFGTYSSGLVAPLIVDLVGDEHFGEAEGFTGGINQIISIAAQFVGSALLLFMSYSSLAFLNAATFLAAGLLFASVGLNQAKITSKKQEKEVKEVEVNDKKFFETMKSSFAQAKKAPSLLTVVFVIALLNGVLTVIEPLFSIVLAANKSSMVIGTYSFTLAIFGVVAGSGMALGSMFGSQLSQKVSLFSLILISIFLSIVTTATVLIANTYVILVSFFFLGLFVGSASITMTQWLVQTVEHSILATTVGLLNTIIQVSGPVMTTIFTTISGAVNVHIALSILLALEVIVLIISSWLLLKNKKASVQTESL